jgi:hypothetical protein
MSREAQGEVNRTTVPGTENDEADNDDVNDPIVELVVKCAREGRLPSEDLLTRGQAAGRRGLVIRELRRACKTVRYKPLTPVQYMGELRAAVPAQEFDTEAIEQALGLDEGGLESLNHPSRSTVVAARQLGLDDEFMKQSLRLAWLSRSPAFTVLAYRGAAATSLAEVCNVMQERLDVALAENPDLKSKLEEYDEALCGLFS